MEVLLKCAACGTEVVFADDSYDSEATCPECAVHLRRRQGDESMAIPVGMVLPDKFAPLDLNSLSKQSEVLIERYRKTPGGGAASASVGSTGGVVDATLAKALESLANTIGHLDKRLSRHEERLAQLPLGPVSEPEVDVFEQGLNSDPIVESNGHSSVEDLPEELSEVQPLPVPTLQVKLEEELELDAEDHRAEPLRATVLVRREAAREAHNHRREKQKTVDHRGREQVEDGLFATLMERYPKSTVFISLLCVVGLTVGVILWMDPSLRKKPGPVTMLEPTKTSSLGKLWANDPEAGHAEAIAKAFLNSTSAKSARPFVFESDELGEQFDELYKPISSPGDYELEFRSRSSASNGEGSIFAYRVKLKGGKSRTLVTLPEGKMPKVYWQFFEEIGDMSWDRFMLDRPANPVSMKVWVEPANNYFASYGADGWSSYIIHDSANDHVLYAFVERNSGVDWKLKKGLETDSRKFGRRTALMAQLNLTFISELTDVQENRVFVAEIKAVEATDWLPLRFRQTEGRTMEAAELPGLEAGN